MARFHTLHVIASSVLFLAFIACGLSFFGPFWLGNVTSPWPGAADRGVEANLSYLVASDTERTEYRWRGLWAQCASDCQWLWEDGLSLQFEKFNPLRWHLAAQVLYFAGAFCVLVCEIYSRIILCCLPRLSVYRSIGFILLTAFVFQSAAIAVFGGFANRDYGATPYVHSTYTYLAWSFWMSVVGAGLTLVAGILYLLFDCIFEDLEEV